MSRLAAQEIIRSRTKWYLGGGHEVIWAPDFPEHLDLPGFWDNACYLEWKIGPLYTITLLDEDLKEIPLRLKDRDWIPSRLKQTYSPVAGLAVVEEKCLLPNDVMFSQLTITNTGRRKRTIYAIIWTHSICGRKNVPGQLKTNFRIKDDIFSYEIIPFGQKGVDGDTGNAQTNIFFAMAMKGWSRSYAVNSTETESGLPRWEFTSAFERMTSKGLDNSFIISGDHVTELSGNMINVALERPLTIPPGGKKMLTTACTLASSAAKSRRQLKDGLSLGSPMKTSRDNWDSFFNLTPRFQCSDKYISRYYWYRWYGLKLNAVRSGHKDLPYPCIFEGVNHGWFRQHISYSAQCHMLEMRWMHSPEIARGSLLNFIHNQLKDGSFTGAVSNRRTRRPAFLYHANWGYAIRKLHESHPDKNFLKKVYPAMQRYVAYFDRARDRENSNLYDVVHQGETGQEYMSRYSFVDKKGDRWGKLRTHLKGVDATVYIYELVKTMSWMAGILGRGETVVESWDRKAGKIRKAIISRMWNNKTKIFCDIHPKTMRKSPVKSSVLFDPFMTDIARKKHLPAIYNHLLNPEEFWTEYPCPSTSVDDPLFSEYGEWKGQRKRCTWSGRSWLMTNSHIAEVLANAAETLDPRLEKYAVEFIRKFFHMTFIDGNIDQPTSYEYYNPFNGKAAFFRGVDDYMHSWMNELIFKYICGVRTSDDNTLTIKPLDFGLTHFTLDDLKLRGKTIKITWRKTGSDSHPKGLTIYINGKKAHHSPTLQVIKVKL